MAKKELIIQSDLSTEQKAVALLLCHAQEVQADIARALKPLDISFTQLNLLHTLDSAPVEELTVNQLKGQLVEESPNVSRALNKLADKALVVKRRCMEDQRTVYISITQKGRDMHAEGDKQLLGIQPKINAEQAAKLYEVLAEL